MKTHMRQLSNCEFVQKLIITSNETPAAISAVSTSTKSVSINCIAFSPQTPYLIIKNLYHKQKTLLAKIEENLKTETCDVIETNAKKITIVIKKAVESKIVIAAKLQSKSMIKFNKLFKSFKSENFIINFNSNSTSIESYFESDIQSNNDMIFEI